MTQAATLEERTLGQPVLSAREPVSISKFHMRELEQLAMPNSLRSALQLFERGYREAPSAFEIAFDALDLSRMLSLSSRDPLHDLPTVRKGLRSCVHYSKTMAGLATDAFRVLIGVQQNTAEESVDTLRNIRRQLFGRLDEADRDLDLREYRGIVNGAFERNRALRRKSVVGLQYLCRYDEYKLLAAFLDAKIKRTEALSDVSTGHADEYMSLLTTNRALLGLWWNYLKALSNGSAKGKIHHAACTDTREYRRIISEIPVKRYVPVQEGPIVVERPVFEQRPRVAPMMTPYEVLEASIMRGADGVFTRDMRARINYFVEDLKMRGMDEEGVLFLADSFRRFDLPKWMSADRARLSELQLRNFFDDITLQYVSRDSMPRKDDLKELYRSA